MDKDVGNSTEGRTNEDGETERVGLKRGHVHRSMKSKTEDTENGKRLKTRKELLRCNPTKHNDHYKLELLGAWKPMCSGSTH